MNKPTFQILSAILVATGVAFCISVILSKTGGLLVYSLDDPYIHLALAENLAAGHGYGINPGEYASPSSSILYPLLLVPLVLLGLGTLAPVALAMAGTLGAAWLSGGLVWRAYNSDGPAQNRLEPIVTLILVFLCANLVGLTLTGMEHTLHVWASLAVLVGLTDLQRDKPVPWTLILGTLACPLLRFEGAALSLAALGVLAVYGHLRASLVLAALIVACFAGYFTFMNALGLPPLPSSVMTKHAASAAALGDAEQGVWSALSEQVSLLIGNPQAILLLVGAGLAVFAASFWDRLTVLRVVGPVVVAVVAHLIAGRYGWFSRYEIYVVALVIGAVFFLGQGALSQTIRYSLIRMVGVAILLLTVSAGYISTTLKTPAAAENIYLQQYQMHRFSTEFYPGPFAANDIGYLAYNNPAYILDLWGLGSEDARLIASDGVRSPEEIEALTSAKDISYVMVYREWFPEGMPEGWCHIAELITPEVSAASGLVSFFLIEPADEPEFRAALDAFKPTIPRPAWLDINPKCDWVAN